MAASGIGRFQVMAILQAARAVELGLKLKEAKSWGLNRAIFYAAARHGFKGRRGSRETSESKELESLRRAHRNFYVLGGEKALRANSREGLRFQMGGKTQLASAAAVSSPGLAPRRQKPIPGRTG